MFWLYLFFLLVKWTLGLYVSSISIATGHGKSASVSVSVVLANAAMSSELYQLD